MWKKNHIFILERKIVVHEYIASKVNRKYSFRHNPWWAWADEQKILESAKKNFKKGYLNSSIFVFNFCRHSRHRSPSITDPYFIEFVFAIKPRNLRTVTDWEQIENAHVTPEYFQYFRVHHSSLFFPSCERKLLIIFLFRSSVSSSPTSNCSSPRLDCNSSLAKLLTSNPVRSYDGGGTDTGDERSDTCGIDRTTETVANKRNTNQVEGSANVNRVYSNTNGFNNRTTTQYQQRYAAKVNNQLDGNKRRCNNSSRMTTTTGSTNLLASNIIVEGNLQTGHQTSKRGKSY